MARRALLIFLLASTLCLAQSATPAKQPKGSVSGSVLRADNSQPIKKAKIILAPSFDASAPQMSEQEAVAAFRDRVFEAESDELGDFSFSDVPAGEYSLTFEKSGFVPAGAMVQGTLPVTVISGKEVKGLEIELRPGGVITGRVVNENGEPMPNVSVQAMRYAYQGSRRALRPVGDSASTNDLGEYRIFGLAPAKYYVRAGVEGVRTYSGRMSKQAKPQAYLPLFYPSVRSVSEASRIELKGNDEQHADFNFAPAPAFRVTGKVLGLPASSNREPGFAEAMLLEKQGHEPMGSAELTARDPTFSFEAVPPGEYLLLVTAATLRGTATGYPAPNLSSMKMGHRDVTVVAADVPNQIVSVETPAAIEVQGKIRIDPPPVTPVDLSQLYVSFEPPDPDDDFMTTAFLNAPDSTHVGAVGSNGIFRYKFVPGRGFLQPQVEARSHGFEDYYTRSVLAGGHDVTETGIPAASIAPGSIIEIVLSPLGARVEGVVLDSNKKPMVDAFVACVPTDPKLHSRRELFVTGRTNQQGHYVLRGLRPGSYKLYAFDEIDPGAIYSSEFLKPFEEMGETVNVQERDTLTKPLQVLHHTED